MSELRAAVAPSVDPSPLPLFREYPALGGQLKRESIGHWPTPVAALTRLASEWGVDQLWVKREDASSTMAGGNKVRGLEFLLGDAVASGITRILTLGAAGSFHVRGTAVHARRFGIDTTAILVNQPPASYVSENMAAARDAHARLIPTNMAMLPFRVAWQLILKGPHTRLIPAGGTCPLACIGHVNAAFELREQIRAGLLPEPTWLFVALGSLGTAAGLVLGCKLAGLRTRVVGVTIFSRWFCTPRRIARLARRTNALMRRADAGVPDAAIGAADLECLHSALGSGYARPTARSEMAARDAWNCEGISLDPTYSAKLFAGARQWLGREPKGADPSLLWHTYAPCSRLK